MSHRPDPQFGIPLSSQTLNPELPFSVPYGVTPDNNYVPLCIDESGKLQIGGISLSGPISISDVTIKGIDPANSNMPQDISVVNWGVNGYALRTSIFYQSNPLIVNTDGSINVTLNGILPVQIEHNLDSVSIYGTDGTNNQFLKTDSFGNLQVGIVGSINPSFSANVSSVSVQTIEIVLLSTNINRKGFSIYNISGDLYIKLGTGITSSSFSYIIPSRGTLELDNYCGVVSANRFLGSGMVLITERI